VLVPVIPIKLDELVSLAEPRKQQLYSMIRERYKCNVMKMQPTASSSIVHQQWSIISEGFLRALALMDHKDDDLDAAVNAFTFIDADMVQRPSKKHTRRCHVRRLKAEPAVKDVAKGTINARDYISAALNKLASQRKALLLREKRGNAPAVT